MLAKGGLIFQDFILGFQPGYSSSTTFFSHQRKRQDVMEVMMSLYTREMMLHTFIIIKIKVISRTHTIPSGNNAQPLKISWI